jgi:translation elongation factor EF-G
LSACDDRRKWADVAPQGVLAWGTPKYHFLGSLLMTSIAASSSPMTTPQASSPQVSSPVAASSNGDSSPTLFPPSSSGTSVACGDASHEPSLVFQCLKESLIAGFLLATTAGSMAEEPMFGLALVVTDVEVCGLEGGAAALPALMRDAGATMSGLVMVAMREACRRAHEQHGLGRRLVEPLYQCVVYSAGATQGKIYAILSRRRAEIIDEVPNEGCDLFYISCSLPAVEAFGLQDELRIATHGAATAQLQMHRWSTVDADPYYKPTTKEDLEEHGDKVAAQNIGAVMLERVRRRKGLHRDLVVESAEKQKFSVKGA